MDLEEHSAAMCMSSSATLRPEGFDERANPPQGGDAKPRDPRGQPSYRTIGNVHVQNTRAGGPRATVPIASSGSGAGSPAWGDSGSDALVVRCARPDG
jgi:hypothetical protein